MVCKKHEWIKNPNPKGLEDVWICKNCGRDRLFSAGFAKAPKDLTQTISFDTKVNARQVIQRIGEDLYKSVGSAVLKLQFESEKMPNKDRDIFIIKKLSNIEKKGAF